jgi:hypothetical protein
MVFGGVQNYVQLLSKISDLYWTATAKHAITEEKLSLEEKFEIWGLFIYL